MSHLTLNIFDQLTDNQRTALSAAFEKRHATIAACGDVMKRAIATLRVRGWRTHEPIWNAALFLNTVAYDLSVNVIELVHERDAWKRRLIARSLALLLYEIGEDIPIVFGKKFRNASLTLGISEAQLKAVGAETKNISAFWNENQSLLKEIRTIAAAHRDHDALALHEAIDGIDLFELLSLGIQMGSLTNSLGSITQAIMNFTSEVEPPELAAKT